MSFTPVDYLIRRDERVLLIDTDNSNPDMHKAHEGAELYDKNGFTTAPTFVSFCGTTHPRPLAENRIKEKQHRSLLILPKSNLQIYSK